MAATTIASVQQDIGFANTYRMEVIKYGLLLAGGLFAFTVTGILMAIKNTTGITMPGGVWPIVLYVGWAALIGSMMSGLGHLRCWELYYISYRDYDWKATKETDEVKKKDLNDQGEARRETVHGWIKRVRFHQFFWLLVGAVAVGVFSGKILLP
jgi:hypothetical protein